MKNFFYFIILLLNFSTALGIESKIIYRIENEIVTNIDIKNEFKYLLALNNQLQELDEEKIFNISKDSIIREKIKKTELSKTNKDLKLDPLYLKQVIENIYLQQKLKTLDEFKDYLSLYDLKLSTVQRKVTIDTLWNELIIKKYNSQVKINRKKLKENITSRKYLKTKDYLLSEIIFEIKNKNNLDKKYNEIKKNIEEIGFKNTASTYSISDTSKIGGSIGWINEQSLNKEIKKKISSLKEGSISEPILIPGGVLILKLDDIKVEERKIDLEVELKKAINFERGKQLSQYSKIYFNKVKQNLKLSDQ